MTEQQVKDWLFWLRAEIAYGVSSLAGENGTSLSTPWTSATRVFSIRSTRKAVFESYRAADAAPNLAPTADSALARSLEVSKGSG